MLGSGMVIIQPSSARIVVVFDRESKTWFLPKGRKDIGESLEQAALRETYEEVSNADNHYASLSGVAPYVGHIIVRVSRRVSATLHPLSSANTASAA